MKTWIILIHVLFSFVSLSAVAHTSGNSFLEISENDKHIELTWEIPLRDLQQVIDMDIDNDLNVVWSEVLVKSDAIVTYLGRQVSISDEGGELSLEVKNMGVSTKDSENYLAIVFRSLPVLAEAAKYSLSYRLFFDLDTQHRGIVKLKTPNTDELFVMSPSRDRVEFTLARENGISSGFFEQGVWHIIIGFDHILFLVCLLLPAVMICQSGKWVPVAGFRNVTVEILKIVTAFSVAHSITLSLVTLFQWQLPMRWIEVFIALSVVLVAINNIYPVVKENRWQVGFVFGLLHGFGFASILLDFNLDSSSILSSLLLFNLGVEVGQLLIVLSLLPLFYLLSSWKNYRNRFVQPLSVTIASLGILWVIERAAY